MLPMMGMSKLQSEVTQGPPELRPMGRAVLFGDRTADCSLRNGDGSVLIASCAAAPALKRTMSVFAVFKP